jgi:2-polyprenyl-3-methyl-5-hydroxy-6-metoxy-1,4-benzoquinol methylase
MFNQFPKKRPDLPEKYKKIYVRHYLENRRGTTAASSLAACMERWMHCQVAADVLSGEDRDKKTLEIGAGNLNHLPYEPGVKVYDVVEPFAELLGAAQQLRRVRYHYDDISRVPSDREYDRITSIAVLEHLEDLPRVIARCGLLLGPSGSLRSGVPNEGTILWRLGYRLTTGVEFWLKYRLDYEIFMRHEHVNTAREIEEVLGYFFREKTVKVLGLSRSLGFYRFFECRDPDRARCREFLNKQ